LEQRIKDLEAKLLTQIPTPVVPSLFGPTPVLGIGTPIPPVSAPGPVLTGTPGDPKLGTKVAELETKVKELDAQMGNVTIAMRGYTFKCLEDCETFVVQYVPGNTYAHFYDMVSLL
jgi:hypothetical protein